MRSMRFAGSLVLVLVPLVVTSCRNKGTPEGGSDAAIAQTDAHAGDAAAAHTPGASATGAAHAAPTRKAQPAPPEEAPSAEVLRAWSKAMREGRARFRSKEYAAAQRAFDEARRLRPEDAATLSELGWAAFNAGDMARAEEATRASLARTSTANVRGATLYNLGRIEEAKGAKERALEAYEQSLRARPNATVLARVRSLEATRADALLPLRFDAAEGPFSSANAFCEKARVTPANPDEQRVRCDAERTTLWTSDDTLPSLGAKAPYERVAFVSTFSSPGGATAEESEGAGLGEEAVRLVVRLAWGTFVSPELATVYNPGAFGIWQSLSVERLEIVPGAEGAPPLVLVAYRHAAADSNLGGAEVYSEDSQFLMLCGAPGEKKPLVCTRPVLYAQHSSYERNADLVDDPSIFSSEPYDRGFALDFAFSAPGALTFKKGRGKGAVAPLPPEVAALVGTHKLELP
jgi:tetratricopeptide (TPR) repeat protein